MGGPNPWPFLNQKLRAKVRYNVNRELLESEDMKQKAKFANHSAESCIAMVKEMVNKDKQHLASTRSTRFTQNNISFSSRYHRIHTFNGDITSLHIETEKIYR